MSVDKLTKEAIIQIDKYNFEILKFFGNDGKSNVSANLFSETYGKI